MERRSRWRHLIGEHGLLCPPGDGAHDRDGLEGEFAVRRFSREHDCVSSFADCNRNVGDFCSSGRGILDHGLQHVGGHNDWLTPLPAALHNPALPIGHLHRPSHSQWICVFKLHSSSMKLIQCLCTKSIEKRLALTGLLMPDQLISTIKAAETQSQGRFGWTVLSVQV